MDFFEKLNQNPYADLAWNIPEKKQGIVGVFGGNAQNFRTEIRVAEFLEKEFPLETVRVVLPDALEKSLPSAPNFTFLSSTESGAFSNGDEITKVAASNDANIFIGDFSKNSITERAVQSAVEIAEKTTIITRDAVDLIANDPEKILENEHVVIFGTMAQLQKITKAVYYPRMLLLSQPLTQVAETLHKFTLSYSASIITFYNGQILVAKDGKVKALPLELSNYSPLTMWGGELAARIAAFNIYNPNNFIAATVAAICQS